MQNGKGTVAVSSEPVISSLTDSEKIVLQDSTESTVNIDPDSFSSSNADNKLTATQTQQRCVSASVTQILVMKVLGVNLMMMMNVLSRNVPVMMLRTTTNRNTSHEKSDNPNVS